MNRIYLLIIFSGLCAGSVYPLIKIADGAQIPKFAYIFWESLLITLLLAAIALCRGQRRLLKLSEAGYYLFCAFTNIIIPQYLFFVIAAHLPASLIGIIIILTPIFIYASLLAFFREPLVRCKVIGMILGFAGAALLFLPELFGSGSAVEYSWLLFSFLLPIDYAVNRIVVSKLLPAGSSNLTLAIGLFSFVAVISCMLMVLSGQLYCPFSRIGSGELALFSHAALMAIFYIIFFILARESAVHNSLSFYVAPLTAMLWGVLIFNERMGFLFCISTILIFYGLYLVTKSQRV